MPRPLFNLARDNRDAREGGTGIRAEASGDTTDLFVYGEIDDCWGVVSAQDFCTALAAISTPKVRLRINSPGGDVCEARAMMAAIADHPASFSARIDGLCASAATAITLACDSVEIVDGGFYMIHNAWTCAMGNAADLRATADVLDKVDAVIVEGYMARTKLPEAEVRALMAAETWFTAQEAVERGFCDSVMAIPVGGKGAQARARAAFNLSVYANVPAALVTPPEDTPDPERHRRQMLARLRLFELQA